MQEELPPLTPDEFVENTNKVSIALAQIGIYYDEEKKSLSEYIIKETSDFVEEDQKEERYDKIFGKLFESQINVYNDGAKYFIDSFVKYCEDNEINANIVDIDNVNLFNNESQEEIIDATTRLVTSISVRFDDPSSLDDEGCPYDERIKNVVSMFIDTSFIIGLTDAESLNYLVNKQDSAKFGNLSALMRSIFPRVF